MKMKKDTNMRNIYYCDADHSLTVRGGVSQMGMSFSRLKLEIITPSPFSPSVIHNHSITTQSIVRQFDAFLLPSLHPLTSVSYPITR